MEFYPKSKSELVIVVMIQVEFFQLNEKVPRSGIETRTFDLY